MPRSHPRAPAPRWLRSVLTTATLTCGLPLLTSCADTFHSLGPTPQTAAAHATELFRAVVARFTRVERTPRNDAARQKLAQAALTPSRIFDDSSVWSAHPSASSRALYSMGNAIGDHYHIDDHPALPPMGHELGEQRHVVALDLLAPSVYRWDTRVDMGIGSVTAAEMSNLITTLLASPEGRTEAAVRNDYRAAFPRTTAAFGRGFAIDSLTVVAGATGITLVTLKASFHPETMRGSYPKFAAYLDKYLGPAKYHFVVSDPAGPALFDLAGRNRAITLRYRLDRGRLTSLAGPPRPWPDTLRLAADVSLKVKIFTVGFHGLLTDFVISNEGRERAWTIVAQREPDWDLPLITERLIRSSLHRPFDGAGSLFSLAVRDSAGAQTVFTRRTRLAVQESALMRFLGTLGSHAIGELDGDVEKEEHQFWHDTFTALRLDLEGHER